MKPIKITIYDPRTRRIHRIAEEAFTEGLSNAGYDLIEVLREAAVYQDEPWDHSERYHDPDHNVQSRAFRQLAQGPFLWLTHKGDLMRPADMPTPHLYYALRMIFNHSVPEEFRTPESLHSIKVYGDVPRWTPEYRKSAINALAAELCTRNPKGLTLAMQDGLRWMDMAARAILREGI